MNEGEVIILLHMLLQQMKAPEDQKTIDNTITDILETLFLSYKRNITSFQVKKNEQK